jgi:putative transposase
MAVIRKTLRLPTETYRGQRLHFVTLCCHERKAALRNPEIALRLIDLLRETSAQLSFSVHAYCFMPDHAHILLEGLLPESNLIKFMKLFKQRTAFEYKKTHGHSLWQASYYDHLLRTIDATDDVAWYIWMNPVRKGLAKNPWEYPFSGSFTVPFRRKPFPPNLWIPDWRKPRSEPDAKAKLPT